MRKIRTTIAGLIPTMVAELEKDPDTDAVAVASNGRWQAYLSEVPHPKGNAHVRAMVVKHHNTEMIAFRTQYRQVIGLHAGWQSQTDKQGITTILASADCGEYTYHSLFAHGAPTVAHAPNSLVVRPYSVRLERQGFAGDHLGVPGPGPVNPNIGLGRWEPPLRVGDTIM